MDTILTTAAAVTGARHHRMARNGQDAAAAWADDGAGAVVVCDGCGSGGSSEVGARLGAQLVIAAVAARLRRGQRPSQLWAGVREQVASLLGDLVAAMPGDRTAAIHEHFLFTVVAAAVAGDEACVWAIGDGGYACWPARDPHGSDALPIATGAVRTLGPFAANQPPYLAYDLLGTPAVAQIETWHVRAGRIAIATDGAMELGLEALLDGDAARLLAHPDGLRRRLAVLARGGERIDWAARRVVRTPAALQDDGAVGVLEWAA